MASPLIVLHMQQHVRPIINNHITKVPEHLSLLQPWDNDDGDTSIAGVANQSIVATGNTLDLEDMDIDQIETNQQGKRQKHYLRQHFSLTEAGAPHFLYQDILAWALEAKCNQYPF
jgi:hypothetical protein